MQREGICTQLTRRIANDLLIDRRIIGKPMTKNFAALLVAGTRRAESPSLIGKMLQNASGMDRRVDLLT